jgi:DNA recombination protein RmuC
MLQTLAVIGVVECLLILFLLWTAKRPPGGLVRDDLDRIERVLREECCRSREETGRGLRELREEMTASLTAAHRALAQGLGELPMLQQNQFEGFAGRLADLGRTSEQKLELLRTGLETSLGQLAQSNEQKQEALRTALETQLGCLRTENDARLEQMRQTVDEKLQSALEKRLGESFNLVAERLELVHRGLGEMQNLATGVGDLKKVLSNIKTRGNWGEVQLEMLLEQMLSPQQYARNVQIGEDSSRRVEFAVRFPGRGDSGEVYLPIDSKFPQEDYQRLVDAQERGDVEAIHGYSRALDDQIKLCARTISEKYIDPPRTTDMAILFLPTEGLYAEIIRRPGLLDSLQRDCRVIVAGPTTLAALLSSFQMGFRTLAIEQRAGEVWKRLGEVKTEFLKFGGILDGVRKKLTEAANKMDDVSKRTRVITRKLRDVEVLPSGPDPGNIATLDLPPGSLENGHALAAVVHRQ